MSSYALVRPYDPCVPPTLTSPLPSVLMPSIDLSSPLTPRRAHSAFTIPLLDPWSANYQPLPPPTIYTTPSTPKPNRKHCSPYRSPSNPFSLRSNAYLSPSDIHTRQTINLHRVIQRITIISSSSTLTRTRTHTHTAKRIRSGWKEHIEPDWKPFTQAVLRVIFWAAVVVYFSALFGVGVQGDQGGLTTRAWNQHIAEPSGMSRMGWKGVKMVDRFEEKRVGEMGRGLQGIWDTE